MEVVRTAMPIFTRCVRAAMAAATASGEASSERCFWKWISASQTASKPIDSAAAICSMDSSNARASSMSVPHSNSVKSPNSRRLGTGAQQLRPQALGLLVEGRCAAVLHRRLLGEPRDELDEQRPGIGQQRGQTLLELSEIVDAEGATIPGALGHQHEVHVHPARNLLRARGVVDAGLA